MRGLLRYRDWLLVVGLSMPGCCVAAGTRVLTPRGWTRVEGLTVGDLVYSVDEETGERFEARIVAVRSTIREIGAVRLGGMELRATSDHPLYCPVDQCYAPAGDWFLGLRRFLAVSTEAGIEHREVESADGYTGVAVVYDISVDHALHNFIAEGVIAHNKSPDVPPFDDSVRPGFDQTACLTDGYDGVSYPAIYRPSADERARYQADLAEFRAAHSNDDLAAYDLMPWADMVTPVMRSVETNDDHGIRIVDRPINRDTTRVALVDFFTEWEHFLNPYGVELVESAPSCGLEYCRYGLHQRMCDLRMESWVGEGFGWPTVAIVTYDTTGIIRLMHSNLLPPRPLPSASPLSRDEFLDLIDGTIVDHCDGTSTTLTARSCLETLEGPVVFVDEIDPDNPSAGVEYRLAAMSYIGEACDGSEVAVAFVDLVVREPVLIESTVECEDPE